MWTGFGGGRAAADPTTLSLPSMSRECVEGAAFGLGTISAIQPRRRDLLGRTGTAVSLRLGLQLRLPLAPAPGRDRRDGILERRAVQHSGRRRGAVSSETRRDIPSPCRGAGWVSPPCPVEC